jgi:hypothetical protein
VLDSEKLLEDLMRILAATIFLILLAFSSAQALTCDGVAPSALASKRLSLNKGVVMVNGVARHGLFSFGNGSCDLAPNAPMFRYHAQGNYIAFFDCVQGEAIYRDLSYVQCN